MVLRASPHKREEKERVRVTLLRAALELGATHGFASLGLREVSRAAHIAPTSFYRHFADMAELGKALIHDLVEPMLRELASSVRSGDPAASARSLAEGALRAAQDKPEVVRFLLAERNGAFVALREGLTVELDALAKQLELGAKPAGSAQLAAATVLALLLDGLARALDTAEADRPALSERLIATMAHAWGQRD
jgi:TetR/AcrR family transcriptional regulator, fatty acid biosynthesis regulator